MLGQRWPGVYRIPYREGVTSFCPGSAIQRKGWKGRVPMTDGGIREPLLLAKDDASFDPWCL